MKPRVCLITTVRHNVGDDFVREGIVWLLEKVVGPVATRLVHKHFPVSARAGWGPRLDAVTRPLQQRLPVRVALSKLADAMPLNPETDAVLSSDIVVQCGAPVYWKNAFSSCAHTEWHGPLIQRRWSQMRVRAPLLNLGAGSCQPLASDGHEIWEDKECLAFICEFAQAAAVTTVRDCLAQQILRQCAREAPLLPCPSVFAPLAAEIDATPADYVALNYMPAGGHFDLSGGAGIRGVWEERFRDAATRLAREHPCLMICHDDAEFAAAARLLPEMPRVLAATSRECLAAYGRCRFAVVNRVHGGVTAAAMGKPVLLVGNDSRLLTGNIVPGVRTLPVTAGREEFEAALAEAQNAAPSAGISSFLRRAEEDYLALLKPVLASAT